MDRRYIAVIDSGIGGISVLKKLVDNFPNENFLYFGDNDNAPYGNRNKRNLLSLTISNINYIMSYDIKCLVVACNTLSVNLFKEISEYVSCPVFGIFPPVEQCQIKQEKTLLLSTVRTAENYKSTKNFFSKGLFDLVNIIENNRFTLDNLSLTEYFKINLSDKNQDVKGYYDNIILGCTHFNFIKKQIVDHFQPQKLLDGTENMLVLIHKFLKTQKSLVKYKENKILFIGKRAKENEKFFIISGQRY